MLKKMMMGYYKFITIGIILILGIGTYILLNQEQQEEQKETKVEENEQIEEEEEEEEQESYPNEISLTTTERMTLIKFLLKHDIYSLNNYNDTNEILTSVVAHKFINWETNPKLTDEQITYITENYELDDYALFYLETYIPYQTVKKYIQDMTGKTPTTIDSSDCMIYIEEYDAYIHIAGHGWWGGSVEHLTFGGEGSESHMYYVDRVTQINADQYVFEVTKYRLKPEHETLNSKTLLEKFILGEYNATQAKIEIDGTVYYLMKKDNTQWQFISYATTTFE